MILIGAIVLGLLVSWFVMSQVPPDDKLKVNDPGAGPYSGPRPIAEPGR